MDLMSKFSKDSRLDYFSLIITLGAAAFFTAFLIRPSVVTAFKLWNGVKEHSSFNKELEQKINNLEKIRDRRSEIKKYTDLLDKAIPSKSNEGDILISLNRTAAKNNLQISSISFAFPTPDIEIEDQTYIIEIKIEAFGTYEQTVAFLSDLNNLLTPIIVDAIKMEPKEKLGLNIVKIVIDARSYYSKP